MYAHNFFHKAIVLDFQVKDVHGIVQQMYVLQIQILEHQQLSIQHIVIHTHKQIVQIQMDVLGLIQLVYFSQDVHLLL